MTESEAQALQMWLVFAPDGTGTWSGVAPKTARQGAGENRFQRNFSWVLHGSRLLINDTNGAGSLPLEFTNRNQICLPILAAPGKLFFKPDPSASNANSAR
jgi:hypothetical protein